jgi:cyanophycinase
MDVLKDEGPLSALRQRYQEGIVFGGTSAGTAIMSHWMMTGNDNLEAIGMDAVQLREGLDLLPPQVMVDTHFIRRQRENRLFSALWLHPDVLGLGIDQGMAVLIEADRWMEVLGPTQVMAVQPESLGKRFIVNLLFSGERYDLERRQTVSN